MSTPSVDSTTARTVCLRVRTGGGSGGGAVVGSWVVIRLRSGAGSFDVPPRRHEESSVDGYAHPAACHAADAVQRAPGALARDPRGEAQQRVRAHAPAR